MAKVLVDKFLEDYKKALARKQEILAKKEKAFSEDKVVAERINASLPYKLNEEAFAVLLNQISLETEKLFDTTEVDVEIAFFEKYLEEEVPEETETATFQE